MTPGDHPTRGVVYWADIGYGRKPWLVVSNNQRNRHLPSVIAVRITTTTRSSIPTIVPIPPERGRAVVGSVLCDDIEQIDTDQLQDRYGALGPATMAAVDAALRIALNL